MKLLTTDMLMGVNSAAKYLGVTRYQLRHWIETEQVKATKTIKAGSSIRNKFSRADLDKLKERLWDDGDE